MRAFCLGLVCAAGLVIPAEICPAADGQTSRGPWTVEDLNAVVDAAIPAAEGFNTKTTRAAKLADLADVLVKVGLDLRAREVLVKAGTFLEAPNDFRNAMQRGKLIEKLARLGDIADAEALSEVNAPPETKAALIGKLGEGRAEAGDGAYAVRVAAKAAELAPPVAAPGPAWPGSGAEIAGIGIALALKGDLNNALTVADKLPNGFQKMRILDQVAWTLCNSESVFKDSARGRDVTGRSLKLAHIALDGPDGSPTKSVLAGDKFAVAAVAADSIAECEGAVEARAFLRDIGTPQSADRVLVSLTGQLTMKKEFGLARTLAPSPDPSDAQDLQQAAQRLLKQGDPDGARRVAVEASHVALKSIHGNVLAQFPLLSSIFGVLAEVGAYDEAIAVVQPIDPINRRQFYLRVIQEAAWKKDTTALARLLPGAIEVLKAPGTGGRLFEIVEALLVGGYREQAQKLFDELQTPSPGKTTPAPDKITPSQVAIFKAYMGDMAAALEAANDAGPMVAKPNSLQETLTTVMQFDNATHPPTKEEIAAAAARSQAALPPLLPGPKANLLAAIVSDMAALGELEAARAAEAPLEAEPRDVLAVKRNAALSSIAVLQINKGDLRGAYITTMRITQPEIRWMPLLKLAAASPDP